MPNESQRDKNTHALLFCRQDAFYQCSRKHHHLISKEFMCYTLIVGQSDRPNVCLFKNRSVIKLHTAAVGQLAPNP